MAELKITAVLDRSGIDKQLESLQSVTVKFSVDKTQLNAELRQIKTAVNDVAGKAIKLSVDRSAITEAVRAARADLRDLGRSKVSISLDTQGVKDSLQTVKSAIKELGQTAITFTVDKKAVDAQIKALRDALSALSDKVFTFRVDGDVKAVTKEIAAVITATKAAEKAQYEAAKAADDRRKAEINLQRQQEYLEHAEERQRLADTQRATAADKKAAAQDNYNAALERTKQALERTHQQQEISSQIENRVQIETERSQQAYERTLQSQEKTKQEHEKVAQAALKASAESARGAREAADANDQLANSVNRVSEAFSGWVTRNIWNALRNGLRDALNTMREMDAQLTTIKRVSGASEAEAAAFQDQAYDMSSKYGVKPADYLANVVAFTRAGYGQLAGDLAEVTTKLQVVGEVSQETATQMLLAVDAAYQLDGNSQELSRVMDGVVAIGDNYATNIEKIAEAIGIVAPIAAQAHVGIDELSAAIGTITADTQRSGTEAARALRYVFLNILQNTSTEVEEGVTLTKEEIEGFQSVLEYFIPDVLATANAMGQVVNPMEALGALAKGVKEDVIDEAQLFEMLTKVAGKLRASQVLALVNDWDKYSDMVKLFGDSVGETDSKVAVSLSSWDAKANMLSASFTKLFGNVLNSSMVKGGLDFLKAFVDLLNIGDGIPAKVLAIGAAFSTISSVISSFATGGRLATTLSSLASFFSNPAFLAGAGIAAALIGIKAIVDEVVVTQAELDDQAKETAQNYGDQKTKLDEITSELEKHKAIVEELEAKGSSRTAAENELLATERELTAELERQARIEEYKTEKAWREAAVKAAKAGGNEPLDFAGISGGRYALSSAPGLLYGKGDITGTVLAYMSAKNTYEAAKSAYETATDPELMAELRDRFSDAEATMNSYKGQVVDYIDKNEGYYKLALDYAEKNNLFTKRILTNDEQSILDFVQYYRNFLSFMGTNLPEFGISGADGARTGGAVGTTGKADKSSQKQSQTDWATAQQSQLKRTQALVKANKEYNDTLQTGQKFAQISKSVYKELTDAGLDLSDAVMQDGDAFIITREALDGFIKSSKEWYEGYGLEMPDNFKAIADNADEAADSIEALLRRAGGMADDVAAASKALADLKAQIKDGGISGDTLTAYRTEYKAVMELWEKGFYGHQELQGFMRLVLGDDKLAELGYDFKEAGKLLGAEFYKALFAPESADDYGIAALQVWANKYKQSGGDVVDSNGDVVASFKYVDGQIKAVVNDYDAAARVLDVNVNTLYMLTDALGIYKNGLNTTGRDIKNLIDGLGDLSTNAEQASNRLAQVEGDKRFHQGNVARDASGRPKITLTEAQAKEWGGQAGETATVLSQAWGYDEAGYTVVFTPIMKDKNGNPVVLSKDSVAQYLDEVVGDGSKTVEEILAADADGLSIIQGIIEGTDKEAVALAESYGQLKHEMHDVQTSSEGTLSNTIDMDKLINRLAMEGKNGQEIFQLINAMKELGDYEFYGDSADPSDLISRIQTAVANANNKDLQLKPDASGWEAYTGEASSAIQTVVEAWEGSKATIDGTVPNPKLDTSGLDEAGATIDKASESVEKLGKTEGKGKASIDTGGVEEGEEVVEGAGEALEDFDGAKGDAKAHLDDEGVAGAAEEVENANKIVKDFNGVKGEGKADLETNNVVPGKQEIIDLMEKLGLYGKLDETAKAKLEADLDDPENRVRIAGAILKAFSAEPYTATADLQDPTLKDVLPDVEDAKKTLSDYGISYDAVVDLANNIDPKDHSDIESLLISLLALNKTFIISVVMEDNSISDGQKLEKIKQLRKELEALEYYSGERYLETGGAANPDNSYEETLNKLGEIIRTVRQLEAVQTTIVSVEGNPESEANVRFFKERIEQTLTELNGKTATVYVNVETTEGGAATSAEDVEETVAEVETAYNTLPESIATNIEAAGATEATGQVEELGDAISGLPDGKTVNIDLRMRQAFTGASGGKLQPGAEALLGWQGLTGQQAEGTRNYPGGRSLVNELGPELIAYGGKAFVAGGGYPTIVNLPKGAMIFDAEETRSIVANSGMPTGGGIWSNAGGSKDRKGGSFLPEPTYTTSNAGNVGGINPLGTAAAAAVGTDWTGTFDVKNKGKGDKYGKGGGGGPAVDNTDYWAIVEAHYKEITAVADNAATNLEYQIKLLKDAWDDEKKPLDEQIKALQDLNGIIDRQITLLTRERDKLTKPIQDEVDALKEAKDIQDDQLELEERQKAVEEARAELQNAQNERTIRFYNKETGHWEWMADQKRVQDAQKALEDAQKSLADFEYDQRIKALEAEIKAIEDEYQDKFDKLNEDKQANEDEIYDLNQQLKDLERKYNELIGPLEEEKEDRSRAKEAAENAWTNAQFERREAPKGNLDLAISKTGVPGSIAGGGIKELQADLKTIANAYKGSQQNNTLASLGIQFGATPSYAGTSSVTTVGNNVTDSHDIVINGITLPASAAYQSLMDLANDLSIYVNYK